MAYYKVSTVARFTSFEKKNLQRYCVPGEIKDCFEVYKLEILIVNSLTMEVG